MKSHSVKQQNMPTYLGIYNALYSDIINEVYPPGELLPGEIALSEKYGVSRNTLRQALAILSEDGMIIKSQGKGTIVASHPDKSNENHFVNPLLSFCKVPITGTRIQYNYGKPTDIAKNKLNLSPDDSVLACNCMYSASGKITGYSFTQIPSGFFNTLNLDIKEKNSIKDCVEKNLFLYTASMNITIRLTNANEIEVEFLQVPLGTPVLLIEALHKNRRNNTFARNKFYFLPEYYNLQFNLNF